VAEPSPPSERRRRPTRWLVRVNRASPSAKPLHESLAIVGYTRWRQVMPELVQAGLQASPHTWAGTPRPYYAAHLAAGVGNVITVEGIPGTATGMDYSAYRFADGKLVVPDAPGFGIGLGF